MQNVLISTQSPGEATEAAWGKGSRGQGRDQILDAVQVNDSRRDSVAIATFDTYTAVLFHLQQ